ncbi:MAG: SipW-dependent-type signal peptide-containing protein [Eubacteriaceae bacterium]
MKKKTIIRLTAIVAIASIIAGFTLAYLTDVTSAKTNTFTASNGIDIQLAEPKWDNLNYDGGSAAITDPLGQTLANNIVPGREIPKNPSIKNASDLESVWVAVKLTYSGDANTFALIDAFASINFDLTGWEAKDSLNTVFYFKTQLAPSDTTTDLFTRVLIDSTADNDDVKSFNIQITGYAVQAEGVSDLTAAKALFASEFGL